MEPELKAKWVEALRSGEFQQGQDYLHRDGAYCCLGVLCRVAGADMSGNTQPAVDDLGDTVVTPTAYFNEEAYSDDEELGGRLRRYFGIGCEVERTLIEMNDTKGADFSQIAAWVETHDLRTGNALEADAAGRPPKSTLPKKERE